MNCLHTLALLEDFADSTLSAAEAASVLRHLRDCPGCRAECDQTKRLIQLLRSIRIPDPGRDYWAENSALIEARTFDTPDRRVHNPEPDWHSPTIRRDFYRSLVSVAAALFVLFAALLVGSKMENQIAQIGDDVKILVVAPDIDEFFASSGKEATRDLTVNLIRGRMLLGPPGLLGRVSPGTGLTEVDMINR